MIKKDTNFEYTKPTLKEEIKRNRIQLSMVFVFFLVWAIYLIGNPAVFTQFQIYRAFLTAIPILGIMALAATFIVTLGEIDLSFPSVMAFCAWVFSILVTSGVNIWIAALASLISGGLLGAFNAFLIMKIGIPAIVATISTQFLFRGLVNVAAGGTGLSLIGYEGTLFAQITVGNIFGNRIPMQAVWFLILAIICWFLFNRHVYGSHVSFIGDNRASAKMMGINVTMVRTIAFVMMGVFAAFAGILSNMEVRFFWPNQGDGTLMPVLAAVFVGGTAVSGGKGTILGTILGVFIIGSLETGIIALGLSGFWVMLIYGAVIIVCISIYSFLSGKRSTD